MVNEIIVDVAPGETRVALLEDKELAEIYIERPNAQRLAGNIYRGKVNCVLPGMQAAFIDIGVDRNAFLYVGDIVFGRKVSDGQGNMHNKAKSNIKDILKVGQEITVQVVKEQGGTKGPRVTTNITLPGRYLVFLPNVDYTGVSRRIENEEERNRLRRLAEKFKP
ncbi:MAG TPA: ribonuclease E/G, partial [Clostridiaceae bacterium]|nr:ribonuclease E/G [Clostridiaceae bacterium]